MPRIFGPDPSKATDAEYQEHLNQCIQTLKDKHGIPRDQQIQELLLLCHMMKQQPNEGGADFSNRFSETQHELNKLFLEFTKLMAKTKNLNLYLPL